MNSDWGRWLWLALCAPSLCAPVIVWLDQVVQCMCACAGITMCVEVHEGAQTPCLVFRVTEKRWSSFNLLNLLAKYGVALTVTFGLVLFVSVFSTVWSGPADEDGTVSVLHSTAIEWLRRVPPTSHHAAVWEQVRCHPDLQWWWWDDETCHRVTSKFLTELACAKSLLLAVFVTVEKTISDLQFLYKQRLIALCS